MKTYTLLAILFLLSQVCEANEQHTIMGPIQKETGFLKYQNTHNGIEVVALSTDIGAGWHKEDLTIYFRDKTKLRRFHPQMIIPMGISSFREFKCVNEGEKLIVKSRQNEEQEFKVFCILQLPTITD